MFCNTIKSSVFAAGISVLIAFQQPTLADTLSDMSEAAVSGKGSTTSTVPEPCQVSASACPRSEESTNSGPIDHVLMCGTGNDGPFYSDGSGLTGDGVIAYGQGHFIVSFSGAFYTPQLKLTNQFRGYKDPLAYSVSWVGAAGWQSSARPDSYGLGIFAGAIGQLGGPEIQDAFHEMAHVPNANWNANPHAFGALAGLNAWFRYQVGGMTIGDEHVGLDVSGQGAFGLNVALARFDLGIAVQKKILCGWTAA